MEITTIAGAALTAIFVAAVLLAKRWRGRKTDENEKGPPQPIGLNMTPRVYGDDSKTVRAPIKQRGAKFVLVIDGEEITFGSQREGLAIIRGLAKMGKKLPTGTYKALEDVPTE